MLTNVSDIFLGQFRVGRQAKAILICINRTGKLLISHSISVFCFLFQICKGRLFMKRIEKRPAGEVQTAF